MLSLGACVAAPSGQPSPDEDPLRAQGTPAPNLEEEDPFLAFPSLGEEVAPDEEAEMQTPEVAARRVTPTAHTLPLPLPRRSVTPSRTLTETDALDSGRLLSTPTVTPRPTRTPRATRTPRPTPTPRVGQGSTTTSAAVNLRAGPGTNYPVQGQIRSETEEFQVVGRSEASDWLQICCPTDDETPVWISADFVEVTLPSGMSLSALPVPELPAMPAGPRGPNRTAADLASAPAVGLPGPGDFSPPRNTNPLTGRPLPAGRNQQRPLIVCINNDFAARPHLGVSQADVMYEYLMEGYGITRLSAIYYGNDAGPIGPVRSARLINYYLGALYDGALACSGASDPVRYSLKHDAPFPYLDFDLDDPNANRYATSVGADYRTRMRTSTEGLRRWLAEWGMETAPNLRGFTFGALPRRLGGAAATAISIPYPGSTGSQVSYRYSNGRYLRSMGGGAYVDGVTGEQLAYENVIVQFVTHEATNIVEDSLGSTSIRLNLFGSNRAIVFRDGQAFVGEWRSESRGDLPRFYSDAGVEIPLKPGRTFISIVPETYTIGYE